MTDGFWNQHRPQPQPQPQLPTHPQLQLHPQPQSQPQSLVLPSQGLPKRPRLDFEAYVPGPSSGHNVRNYATVDDDRAGPHIVKDTQAIGSAYDRFLQKTQLSPMTSGEGNGLGGVGLTRLREAGVPQLPGTDLGVVGRPGVRGVVNGQDAGFQELLRNPMLRPTHEPAPLPPGATSTLYVEGLPPNSTRREVAHIFRPFMGYKEVRLVTKESKHRGGDPIILCFVDFADPACAATAMSALQGYKMDEQDTDSAYLRLQFSRSPGPKSGYGPPRGRRYILYSPPLTPPESSPSPHPPPPPQVSPSRPPLPPPLPPPKSCAPPQISPSLPPLPPPKSSQPSLPPPSPKISHHDRLYHRPCHRQSLVHRFHLLLILAHQDCPCHHPSLAHCFRLLILTHHDYPFSHLSLVLRFHHILRLISPSRPPQPPPKSSSPIPPPPQISPSRPPKFSPPLSPSPTPPPHISPSRSPFLSPNSGPPLSSPHPPPALISPSRQPLPPPKSSPLLPAPPSPPPQISPSRLPPATAQGFATISSFSSYSASSPTANSSSDPTPTPTSPPLPPPSPSHWEPLPPPHVPWLPPFWIIPSGQLQPRAPQLPPPSPKWPRGVRLLLNTNK